MSQKNQCSPGNPASPEQHAPLPWRARPVTRTRYPARPPAGIAPGTHRRPAGTLYALRRSSTLQVPWAEGVDKAVTHALKKAIGEAEGKRLDALKKALAEAQEKMK